MTLYTQEIRTFLRTRPWPSGFQLDVIEEEFNLKFVMYRDNFITFPYDKQMEIASIIKEVMEKIRGMGVPCYMDKLRNRQEFIDEADGLVV